MVVTARPRAMRKGRQFVERERGILWRRMRLRVPRLFCFTAWAMFVTQEAGGGESEWSGTAGGGGGG